LSLIWQRWHVPFDKFIFSIYVLHNLLLWRYFHWNSLTLLVTLMFFNIVQICVQSILPTYCPSHLIWHFGFIFCLKIPWITFIFNLSGDIVVFDSFKNCSLSLMFKVTLRSGTIVDSPFKTFMNFSGISFFIFEKSEIQFLLSINILYISWQLLTFVLFESQISLLCRNEVNTKGLSLKLWKSYKIYWFLEWNQCHYYTIESVPVILTMIGYMFCKKMVIYLNLELIHFCWYAVFFQQ
jgi:hypothetical protein